MSNAIEETLDRKMKEYVAQVVEMAPEPLAWESLTAREMTMDSEPKAKTRRTLIAVSAAVAVVAIAGAIIVTNVDGSTPDGVVLPPGDEQNEQPGTELIEVEPGQLPGIGGPDPAEWPAFESPTALVSASDVVVAVRPADASTATLLGTRGPAADGVEWETWGRAYVVEEVLAGAGVAEGDEVTLTWLRPRTTVTAETGEVYFSLGGEGYLDDLDSERAIVGLVATADVDAWSIVAAIQGVIAFEEVDGEFGVAESTPGVDGFLQQNLDGLTYEEVRGLFGEVGLMAG